MTTLLPALSREQAIALATFWRDNGLHIYWTDSKTGGGAKRCSRKWDELAKPIDGELGSAAGKIAQRLKTRNPIVALRNSGLVGIDCDSPEDVAAFKAFGAPPTWSVKTSNGRHFYYRAPASVEHHAILFEKGSVQAKGNQYLVAPPAVHPSGRVYEGSDLPIVELPRDVLAAMVAAAGRRSSEERERIAADPDAKVTEGGRHALLLSEAGRLARVGSLDEEGVAAALLRINETRCDPPKDELEVRRLAREAVEHWRQKSAVDRLVSENSANVMPPTAASVLASLESIDDHVPESVLWHAGFEGIFPRGELVNLIAPGGTGKGLLVALLTANAPDGQPILYSGTEDSASRLKMRLDAAGVRPGRFLRAWGPDGEPLTFPSDVPWIKAQIEATSACAFVFDPGAEHLDPGLKNDKVEDVGAVVRELARIAELTGCTIINVLHPPKSGDMLTGLGSGAWVTKSRHSLFMVKDDDEPDDLRHVVAHKTNIAESGYGRTYRIHTRDVKAWDAELGMMHDTPCPYVVWEGESSKSVLDLLKKQSTGAGGGEVTKSDAAYELIRDLLTVEGEDGDVIKSKVVAAIGCSGQTVWRAWKRLRSEGIGEYRLETTGAFGSGAQRHVWRLAAPTTNNGGLS